MYAPFPAKCVFQSATSVYSLHTVIERAFMDERAECVSAARVTEAARDSARLVVRSLRCKRSSLREL